MRITYKKGYVIGDGIYKVYVGNKPLFWEILAESVVNACDYDSLLYSIERHADHICSLATRGSWGWFMGNSVCHRIA